MNQKRYQFRQAGVMLWKENGYVCAGTVDEMLRFTVFTVEVYCFYC